MAYDSCLWFNPRATGTPLGSSTAFSILIAHLAALKITVRANKSPGSRASTLSCGDGGSDQGPGLVTSIPQASLVTGKLVVSLRAVCSSRRETVRRSTKEPSCRCRRGPRYRGSLSFSTELVDPVSTCRSGGASPVLKPHWLAPALQEREANAHFSWRGFEEREKGFYRIGLGEWRTGGSANYLEGSKCRRARDIVGDAIPVLHQGIVRKVKYLLLLL